ncbi:MAG: UDP-N-acetylglucosamine--N-acetylmuramyl-(pentapeptide) pyrophosphoryl-undecaprenol N-acetylglucosamine transferase, partial [Candidatus Gracilibacteria bacterium]
MRIVLTGGGTAGHVIPNLALIEELKTRRSVEILYVGEKNGVEKNLIEKVDVNFRGIYCGKMRRYFSIQNFIDLFKIPIGILQARKILKKFNVGVVFSKGGYVSFPVCIAANMLKIPVIIHESDLIPGLANKMCMSKAKKILTSFEETKNHLPEALREKVVYTGNPIRKEIFEGDKEKGYRLSGFNDSKKIILVMGGSSGARQINELVRASLDELTKKFQI